MWKAITRDGGTIKNHLWLNLWMKMPQLLVQPFCLLPIHRDFYVLLISNGKRTPCITFTSVARFTYTFAGINYVQKFITVRLTFLTHSVCMRPNFQGLQWFDFDGLGEDELLI